MNRGPPEHWLFSGTFKRVELQKALGNHLSWKERWYPLHYHLYFKHAIYLVTISCSSFWVFAKIKKIDITATYKSYWITFFSMLLYYDMIAYFLDNISYLISWHLRYRYPTFFDDIAARLLPVIPLIIYRLIENDAIDAADRVLQYYSAFLHYYPLNFTFVRDILAYFYGHLPGKLILRILTVLDVKKVMALSSSPKLLK